MSISIIDYSGCLNCVDRHVLLSFPSQSSAQNLTLLPSWRITSAAGNNFPLYNDTTSSFVISTFRVCQVLYCYPFFSLPTYMPFGITSVSSLSNKQTIYFLVYRVSATLHFRIIKMRSGIFQNERENMIYLALFKTVQTVYFLLLKFENIGLSTPRVLQHLSIGNKWLTKNQKIDWVWHWTEV